MLERMGATGVDVARLPPPCCRRSAPARAAAAAGTLPARRRRSCGCRPRAAKQVSVDQNVALADARARLGAGRAVQGNLDPAWLVLGNQQFIQAKVDATVRAAGGSRHVLNLGHGVMPSTPEENVAHFFEAARSVHTRVQL